MYDPRTMKESALFAYGITACCLLSSCVTPLKVEVMDKGSPDTAALVKQVDNLCWLTQMRRIGPVVECQKRTGSNEMSFFCRAYLQFERDPIEYHINFDQNRRIVSFMPANMKLSGPPGKDTVTGPKRQQLMMAVRRINATFGFGCFGAPAMQKVENHYVVSFSATPERQDRPRGHAGPSVSFFITESMTVFGVLLET